MKMTSHLYLNEPLVSWLSRRRSPKMSSHVWSAERLSISVVSANVLSIVTFLQAITRKHRTRPTRCWSQVHVMRQYWPVMLVASSFFPNFEEGAETELPRYSPNETSAISRSPFSSSQWAHVKDVWNDLCYAKRLSLRSRNSPTTYKSFGDLITLILGLRLHFGPVYYA